MRKLIIVFAVAIVLAVGATAQSAPITQVYGPFDVTFYNSGDSDGYYSGVQNWTAGQMADVGAAVQSWSSLIGNVPGRQIQMHVFWQELDPLGTNVLGGSLSPSNGDGTTSWNYGEHVWRDGVNYSGPFPVFDTVIQYDITAAGFAWNFGADAPGASEIDFRSVVAHEIGHSLGWTDTYYPAPWDDWGNTFGTVTDLSWAGFKGLSEWDKNLVDSLGNRPLNGDTGIPDNFNEVDDPVYWDGLNAVSYYGSAVPIFAPDSFKPGSSLTHLDYDTFPGLMMSPYIKRGAMNRTVSGLERAMMKDMGWNVIPAPGAILLSSIGVGLVGWLRRRKSF